MSLSVRDLDRLALSLESQGARVRRTKSGYFIYAPNGQTMGFHLTPSDENQERQMQRDVRRCGLEFCF